jgi:DnaA family protein
VTGQLPLDLRLHDDATFDNFLLGDNTALCQALRHLASPEARSEQAFLFAASGSGRSHLLQAVCHAVYAGAEERVAMYLPLDDACLRPEILDGLEYCAVVALDNIDAVLGCANWEEALFHFYNRACDAGVNLVFSAKVAPRALQMQLPDLRSRLSYGMTFQVKPLSDEQKIAALVLRAKNLGLELPEEVGRFLLRHYQRDMAALFILLKQLDRASIAMQRRLTIPFVKTQLEVAALAE